MKLLIEIDEAQKKMVDAIMELPPQVENDLISAIRHGVPLPEHHGDLVDRNYLIKKIEKCVYRVDRICADDIYYAPTIIPATKEGDRE